MLCTLARGPSRYASIEVTLSPLVRFSSEPPGPNLRCPKMAPPPFAGSAGTRTAYPTTGPVCCSAIQLLLLHRHATYYRITDRPNLMFVRTPEACLLEVDHSHCCRYGVHVGNSKFNGVKCEASS
jgi:hypothetical protein